MIARVADTHPVEARSSVVTVVEAYNSRAVLSIEAGSAHAFAIYTVTITLAVVGTGVLSTVLPGEPLIAVAGAIHAASTVIAVFEADEFRAVRASPGFITNAVSVFTAAAALAVVEALGLRAVFAVVTIGADAFTSHTLAVCTAVHRAVVECAVLSGESLEAHTLSANAEAPVLAVIRTLGFRAVRWFPARLTYTATGFSAVVPMTTAVGFSSQLTFDKKVERFFLTNVFWNIISFVLHF